MGHVLRTYQREAADAPYEYWAKNPEGNPLIVVPTGGGKSLILSTISQEFVEIEPTTRIVMATHVQELIEQNYAELMGLWPWAPAGIYSAGLRRKDAHAQILFGGIASMVRAAHRIGHVDILIIDEAHRVPPEDKTNYRKFIAALKEINPRLLILGLTATPYRLDGGMLTDGDDALFDDIIYEITIKELVDLGYLCPLVSKATATAIDMKGLRRSGSDYTQKSLSAVFDKIEVTREAVQEVISFANSNENPRRSWLFFCAGVEHAKNVRDEIRSHGYTCEAVYGDMDKIEGKGRRRQVIEDFKGGKIKALTNSDVLTTGFNAPRVDLLVMLRKTDSTSLYVQMAGRGTRCIGKDIEESIRNGKSNCLVLDFAGNVRRHGPVDMVKVRAPGKGEGDAPVKECPKCHSLIFAGLMECPDCGHEFERDVEKNIKKTADAGPIMSQSRPDWVKVTRRTFYRHEKPGMPISIKVSYLCGWVEHCEWICPEHQGFARVKFEKWWKQHGGGDDAPFTVNDCFERAKDLKQTAEIMIKANGKYWEIVARKLADPDPSINPVAPAKPSRETVLRRHEEMVAERKATMPGHVAPRAAAYPTKPWNAQITPPIQQPNFDDDIPF